MTATETSISNSALIKIGSKRITSIDDDLKEARVCKEQLPKIRDEVLASHPWNCAIRRAQLGLLAESPIQVNDSYTNQFQLPSDCLRVLEIDADPSVQNWVVEGGILLTNNTDCRIRYISLEPDYSKYSPSLLEAIAWRLAADLAFNIMQNSSLGERIFVLYERHLALARSIDSQEGGLIRLKQNYWTSRRMRRGP